jgi:hypothetical protein
MINLSLTEQEAQLITQMADLYLRNNGLQNSAAAVNMVIKVEQAVKVAANPNTVGKADRPHTQPKPTEGEE